MLLKLGHYIGPNLYTYVSKKILLHLGMVPAPYMPYKKSLFLYLKRSIEIYYQRLFFEDSKTNNYYYSIRHIDNYKAKNKVPVTYEK